MDKLQEFINKLNGQKGVGNTSENRGECVGLVMVWLKDTLGQPHVWGNAQDLLANADKNAYNIVYNTPTGIPPRGSVIVWKKAFNGTVGHTAIVTRADVNTFEVFEQNNPTGSGCRLHTYPNYNHVDGWIIPKAQAATQPSDREVRDQYNKDLISICQALEINQDDADRTSKILLAVKKLQDRPDNSALKKTIIDAASKL